jgi:hypothetical protein
MHIIVCNPGDYGGGYYDDVEVGRLGTNPSADAQALSFEMDLRKDLPWASPAADRLARRRPSVGYALAYAVHAAWVCMYVD